MGWMMTKRMVDEAKALCRELRKKQTKSETLFLNAVRNKRFLGIKFFRQHPIFVTLMNNERFFIADFYSRERHAVLELDGKTHEYQKDYDQLRTEIINTLGVMVVRFRNEEIESDLPRVLRKLGQLLKEGTHPIIPL